MNAKKNACYTKNEINKRKPTEEMLLKIKNESTILTNVSNSELFLKEWWDHDHTREVKIGMSQVALLK